MLMGRRYKHFATVSATDSGDYSEGVAKLNIRQELIWSITGNTNYRIPDLVHNDTVQDYLYANEQTT